LEQKKQWKELTVIDLSRNFGHHYAAHAGLSYASGEYIFIIDCDLEVSPSVLKTFFEKISSSDADVIYGYQEQRKGNAAEKHLGALFWNVFNRLSRTKVPANILTERICTQRYRDALMKLGDKNLFLAGMYHWAGFQQIGIPIVKKQRQGRSSYSFLHRINLMLDAVSSFSEKPLRLLFNLGVYSMFFAFSAAVYLAVKKLIYGDAINIGWTSIITLIFFVFGTIMCAIGVLGIYLSKILTQIQNRPLYIIKEIHS
jgi:putative glycosyltransferase